ncbi:cystathionine gamma-synthase [Halorubrum sp. Ib24]|uniref:trans-sulfuration enzyme family protein n=1 Tax=Halorubrum sp. Ib24 TaxID=1383850 RepID=UPI000B97E7D0|nr:PLP-dependent aspartate aminotransferase family protein [Halorubrum sp. Ib24]OYR40812.1 cystathionine gamma-synthase [Halorubrum sp. Ib24]
MIETFEFATEAVHRGETAGEQQHLSGDVVSPIHLATHHEMEAPGEPKNGYKYARFGNPTRDALESRLAHLTGGSEAIAFNSGTAAITTTALALCDPGDHLIAFDGVYGGTRLLLDDLFGDVLGVEVEYVDARSPETVKEHIKSDTALFWMESPTNPLLKLCDIAELADVADAHEIPLCVENTFATPYLQQPLELGADMVVHSTTKYLNGHSDSTGGAVATDDPAIADRVSTLQEYVFGNTLSPFDAYLVLRGAKTLPLRMEQHEANAQTIAEFLADHPKIQEVHYPGLESHPQHGLARQQMDGFGGIVSFELEASEAETRAFIEGLDVFTVAVSLGGVESLVDHPWTMSASFISPEERRAAGVSDSLVRMPVGIEDSNDLIQDIKQSLSLL